MSKKLWAGRFDDSLDTSFQAWTESTTVDECMVEENLWGSMAHVIMLARQDIIPADSAREILSTLKALQDQHREGNWKLDPVHEDVQMNVEHLLIEQLGLKVGGSMHTARSRNDQIPSDTKLHVRNRLIALRMNVSELVELILEKSSTFTENVMVSYTHTQHAQPISIGYWMSHYAAVLLRDMERLRRAYALVDKNPLGACALAGTSFPIDRHLTAHLLGYETIQEHGMDAVSARDYYLETVSALGILMTTIGRFAEEMVMWTSYEFRTARIGDDVATGSSIMPQKRNPAVLELLRARAGRMNGLMAWAFSTMKGLPSGYNRDFNEEKNVMWQAFDVVDQAVLIMHRVLRSITFDTERMAALCLENFSNATELANTIVREHGHSFRSAHHIIGSVVGSLSKLNKTFEDTHKASWLLKDHGIDIPADRLAQIVSPKMIVESHGSEGGTSSTRVLELILRYRQTLAQSTSEIASDSTRIETALNECREIAAIAQSDSPMDEFNIALNKIAAH